MGLLCEGEVILGKYEIERFLGEGAFAEVYRVKHRRIGRLAMKVFKLPGMSAEETDRLLGEAELLSRLNHRNIIRVFDADTLGRPRGEHGFFTMEYVPGGTLERFWRSHGAQYVPVKVAVDIIRQACQGLAVAHCETPPIIHRDIKPQNLLVGYDGTGMRIVVSDFGLAKRANPLTQAASARGTLVFMPPEVLTNPLGFSCAGDVWALACVFYILLTDRLPWTTPAQEGVFRKSDQRGPITPASKLNSQVDPSLDAILLRALALRPEDRYGNAKEMLTHLNRWVAAAEEAPTRPPGGSDPDRAKGEVAGTHPLTGEELRKAAREAIALSRRPGRLAEAADLLEGLINASPELRAKYEHLVQLWRRGVFT